MNVFQDRSLLFLAVVAFIMNAMVFPAVRMRLRHGQWGIAIARSKDPLQRLVGGSLSIGTIGLVAWSILYAFAEPTELGIWSMPSAVRAIGWALMVTGFLLVVAAQANMGRSWRIGIDQKTTALVTDGLYRVIRNPIYTGMIVAYSGFVLVTPASWTVMAFLMILLILEVQARLEEKHLAALHGRDYFEYAGSVGRFFPGIGRSRAW